MLPGWVNARVRHAGGSDDHGAEVDEDADTSSVSRRCGLVATMASDEHGARGLACVAGITTASNAVEPCDIAGFEGTCFVFGDEGEAAFHDECELDAFEEARLEDDFFFGGAKVCDAGVHAGVRDKRREAVGNEICAGVGVALQTYPFLAAKNTEGDGGVVAEEVGEILLEGDGDASEIAYGGNYATGFELGEEGCREFCFFTEFYEPHRTLHAEATDAVAKGFVFDDCFRLLGVYYIEISVGLFVFVDLHVVFDVVQTTEAARDMAAFVVCNL